MRPKAPRWSVGKVFQRSHARGDLTRHAIRSGVDQRGGFAPSGPPLEQAAAQWPALRGTRGGGLKSWVNPSGGFVQDRAVSALRVSQTWVTRGQGAYDKRHQRFSGAAEGAAVSVPSLDLAARTFFKLAQQDRGTGIAG